MGGKKGKEKEKKMKKGGREGMGKEGRREGCVMDAPAFSSCNLLHSQQQHQTPITQCTLCAM